MEGRRVCWPERGRAELAPFAPREPKAGEVLVQSEVTLISPGTERAFFLGLPNAQGSYPSYPGYSNIGRVVALGEGVRGVAVGDRVASGASHASHVTVGAERCWRVPEGLASEEAVYFNLAAIALQGVRKARIELGEVVLVVGQGLIGNLALQLARLQGALPAIGLDPDAGRREIATQCGADIVLAPDEIVRDETLRPTPEALAAHTDGRGADVVIEATGSPEPLNEAFALAGHHGRVVLLASTRGITETNFYRDIHKRGLTVLGAHAGVLPPHDSSPGYWNSGDDRRTVLRLLAARRVQVRPLTSLELPSEKAPEAYDILASWRKDLLGMILRWHNG